MGALILSRVELQENSFPSHVLLLTLSPQPTMAPLGALQALWRTHRVAGSPPHGRYREHFWLMVQCSSLANAVAWKTWGLLAKTHLLERDEADRWKRESLSRLGRS